MLGKLFGRSDPNKPVRTKFSFNCAYDGSSEQDRDKDINATLKEFFRHYGKDCLDGEIEAKTNADLGVMLSFNCKVPQTNVAEMNEYMKNLLAEHHFKA